MSDTERKAMEAGYAVGLQHAREERDPADHSIADEMLEELRRENAFLRGRHRHWFTEAAKAMGEVGGLRRENERLRTALRRIRDEGYKADVMEIVARVALNPTEVDG